MTNNVMRAARHGAMLSAVPDRRRLQRTTFACGVLSSLLYLLMNLFIPMLWDDYSSASQTVSELSAIGAPTRSVWVPLGVLYTLLLTAFGWGVRALAGERRSLRVAGTAMMAQGIIGLYWPPMHLRGALPTLTDTLHIVWSAVTILFMMVAIGFGAAAFGRRFRLYSTATLAIFVLFGTLTGLEAPGIAANTPTPWIGLWERINIAAFMTWVVVLALAVTKNVPRPRIGVNTVV
jgi:hypothetical protein